jgi:hypothetical protein
MNKKPIHFLEIVWILVGIACLVFGIQKAIDNGIGNSYTFFILAAVAFSMYALRRHLRKNDKST